MWHLDPGKRMYYFSIYAPLDQFKTRESKIIVNESRDDMQHKSKGTLEPMKLCAQYLSTPQPVDNTAAWTHEHLVSWWGVHWALQSAEDCSPALTFTSDYQVQKLSAGSAHQTSMERGVRWENIKIRLKASTIMVCCKQHEGSKSERGACCCRRNRVKSLDKSTIGGAEAAEAECRETMWRNSLLFATDMPRRCGSHWLLLQWVFR